MWDPTEKTIIFGNGGHPYPLLARASGEVESLDDSDLAVGIFATAKYSSKETKLELGDTLVLYTDGGHIPSMINSYKSGIYNSQELVKEAIRGW